MEKFSLKERIVKNSFWSFMSAMISRVGVLIFTIVLTRFLLPEGFGIYSIVISLAMIFYTFTDIGINQAATRYLSHSFEKNKKKLPAYYYYLFKVKFVLALTSSFLLFVLAYPISFYLFKNPALFLPLLVSAFYIFVMSIESFYLQLFYTFEKSEFTTMRYSLEQTLRITVSLLIFYFLASSYHILGIFVSYIFIYFFLLFFNLYYVKKLSPAMFKKSTEEIDKKRVRKFIGFLTIATISGAFFSHIDSIMLGIFIYPEYVGYYRAAFSLVWGIAGILLGPTSVFLTYFSKINKSESSTLINQSFKFLSIFSIPCIFALLILGKYFVRLFFGYSFLPAAFPLYFLAFFLFPLVVVGPFLSLFSAAEKTEIFAKLILLTSIINIVLNLVLIKVFLSLFPLEPIWATAGASLATMISWFFYLFSFVYLSKKKLKTKVSFMPVIKPISASIIMSFFLILSINFIGDMTLISGIFVIFIGMLTYFISILMLKGITINDLKLVRILFKTKNNRKILNKAI